MKTRPIAPKEDLPRIRMLLEAIDLKLWGGDANVPLARILREVHKDRSADPRLAAESDDDLFVRREFSHAMMVLEGLEIHDGHTLDVPSDWQPAKRVCRVSDCPDGAILDFCPKHIDLRPT